MFLELIGTIFAGVAAAGVMMLVNKLTGQRLPKWLVPVAAGAAMILVTISSEYGWYDRTTATMPEGLSIAQTVEKQSFYRPWTYVKPYVDRFVAVDELSIQRHPDLPDQRLAKIYFYGRWSPINELPVLVDCAAHRRANLADGAEFDDTGRVVDATWIGVSADDPVLVAICGVA